MSDTGSVSQKQLDMLNRADQLRRAGRMAEAEQQCRLMLQAFPGSAAALSFLGLLISARGDQAEAEELLRRATAIMPGDAALHSNLGNILRLQGDFAAAEDAYRAAIARAPNFAEAHYNLGLTLRDLRRPAEAFEAHKKAATLRGNYAPPLVQIGALLAEQSAYADALKVLDAAVEADPKSFEAHYTRSAVLTALERHADAVAALKTAIKLEPARHEAHFALANAYVAVNENEAALDSYSHAIERAPDFLPAHHNLNTLAWSLGKGDPNLGSFAYARSRTGETPDLLLAEAELRLQRGEAPAADALLEKAYQAAPQRADIVSALGRSRRTLNRLDESIALFQKALSLEPRAVKHRQDLAIAFFGVGEKHLAKKELEQAFALAPFDQLTLAYLALAYRELGDSRYGDLVDIDKYVRSYDLRVPNGYADAASFNAALAEDLKALHTQRFAPLDQTLRDGTQTTGFLFSQKSKAIAQVRDAISEAVTQYICDIPDTPGHPVGARKAQDFSFSGAWSCRLNSSGFHTNHMHPEGWISSAYYVSLPDAVEDATAQQGWLKFGESNLYLGGSDRAEHAEKPKVGKLVLFPSYYWHGTVPFQSDRHRLSIAFDAIPGKVATPRPGVRNSY